MKFRNSVGARAMLSQAGVIAVFAIAVAFGIGQLSAFNVAVTKVTGAEFGELETTEAWAAAVSESMQHARNILIMDDKTRIQQEIARVRGLGDKIRQDADSLAARVHEPRANRLLQDALNALGVEGPFDQEFLRECGDGDIKAAKDTLLQRALPAQLALTTALGKLGDYQREQIHEHASAAQVSYERARVLLVTLGLAAMAGACMLAYLLARPIWNGLERVVSVLSKIEKGDYASEVIVGSNNEIGWALRSLDRVRAELSKRAEREQALATENARIRAALDRVSVGVMLGDATGTIIYVNDALRLMFRSQAGEIRKAVPSFVPDPMGNSFDLFQDQVPILERHALSALTAAQTLDVKMGEASLRIVASPVHDSGNRVGTVVQWVDRTQEMAIEEEVQNVVAKAIDGDLTLRIREQGKEAFFKALAIGTNRLLENMADVVRSMARAAAEVRTGAEEISRGNADLSQRTEEQASSLEETASSMEEMTSTVKNNADNAAQANQLTTAAREQAQRGGAVVSAAIAAMGEINASSKRIADITSVIDEIAFQTNLLALNAAVEAARAGEQGRGFAVVASEVRNLASRSAEAAKEIKALIQDSVAKVTEGTKLVNDSGRALGEIVDRVKRVTEVMAEILNSSREQSSGIEQVNKAITSIDNMTQQNAALVEQAAAAAQALTEQASNLSQLIAGYRVEVGGTAGATPVAPRQSAADPRGRLTERRALSRPFSGEKRRAAVATAPTVRIEGDWKDF